MIHIFPYGKNSFFLSIKLYYQVYIFIPLNHQTVYHLPPHSTVTLFARFLG